MKHLYFVSFNKINNFTLNSHTINTSASVLVGVDDQVFDIYFDKLCKTFVLIAIYNQIN